MGDVMERKVGDLTIRIDRSTCAAFRACIGIAPDAFELGDDQIVRFKEETLDEVEASRLIEACKACPVQALTVIDEEGNQLIP